MVSLSGYCGIMRVFMSDGRNRCILAIHGSDAPFPHLVCGNCYTVRHNPLSIRQLHISRLSFPPPIIGNKSVKNKMRFAVLFFVVGRLLCRPRYSVYAFSPLSNLSSISATGIIAFLTSVLVLVCAPASISIDLPFICRQ